MTKLFYLNDWIGHVIIASRRDTLRRSDLRTHQRRAAAGKNRRVIHNDTAAQ
jgi:hypothetical protein